MTWTLHAEGSEWSQDCGTRTIQAAGEALYAAFSLIEQGEFPVLILRHHDRDFMRFELTDSKAFPPDSNPGDRHVGTVIVTRL